MSAGAVSARRRCRCGRGGRRQAGRLRHCRAPVLGTRRSWPGQDWTVPLDGIEWLNADSEWRDEQQHGSGARARSGTWRVRRERWRRCSIVPTLRWRSSTNSPPGVMSSPSPATMRTGASARRTATRGRRLHLPSYEAAFRTFSRERSGARSAEGKGSRGRRAQCSRRSARGRVFTAVDAIASPAALDFASRRRLRDRRPSATCCRTTVTTVRFLARAAIPAGASLVLLRDGAVVSESPSNTVEYSTRAPGSYRVEVRVAGAPGTPPIPWIVSSPIFRFAAPRGETPPAAGIDVVAAGDRGRGVAPRKRRRNDGGIFLVGRWRGSDLSPRHQSESIRGTGRRPAVGARRLLRGRLQGPRLAGRCASRRSSASRRTGKSGGGDRSTSMPREASFALPVSAFRAADRPGTMPDTTPRELDPVRHRHDEREARRRGQFHDSGRRAAPVRGVRHGSDPCLTRQARLQVFTVRNMKPEAPRTMMLGDQAASQGVRRPLLPSATNRLVTIQ